MLVEANHTSLLVEAYPWFFAGDDRISTELLGFTKMGEFGRLQSVLFALNAVLGHSQPLEDVIISSSLICRPSDCVQFKPLLLLSILSYRLQ